MMYTVSQTINAKKSIRYNCGHNHRSLLAAIKCRDGLNWQNPIICHINGMALTADEINKKDEIEFEIYR